MSGEADERLAAGPRGAKGEQGERGVRGLPRRVAWAIVVLFAFCALGIVGNLLWTGHETAVDNAHWHQAIVADDAHWRQALAESQRKFCGVIGVATSVVVPKPADPAANPSRETAYVKYVKAVGLGRSLGC